MKNILLAVAVFAAAFVSCNKETEVVPSPNSFTDGARIALTLTDDAADTHIPPNGSDDPQTPQAPPDDKIARREGPFTAETTFSTRFFVLHYTSSGTLTQADLDNSASVTEDDTQE